MAILQSEYIYSTSQMTHSMNNNIAPHQHTRNVGNRASFRFGFWRRTAQSRAERERFIPILSNYSLLFIFIASIGQLVLHIKSYITKEQSTVDHDACRSRRSMTIWLDLDEIFGRCKGCQQLKKIGFSLSFGSKCDIFL